MPTEVRQEIPNHMVPKKLTDNTIRLEAKSISEGSRSDSGLPTVLPIPTQFSNPPSDRLPHIGSHEEYLAQHRESLSNPTKYWSKLANELLTWNKPFSKVLEGSFEEGNVTWFEDGELNASVNCVDRHAETDPDRVAIIFEANEPGTGRHVTYSQLSEMVNRLANVLLSYGLKKGDTVAIYLPMVPEALAAVLACTRIGVLHSLVFAGFSAASLGDRIRHSQARVVITSDEGLRGSKKVPLKTTTDEAVADCPSVERVLVLKHTGNPNVPFNSTKDRWWHEEMEKQSPICPPVSMKAEDPLFILYTSGSTGAPKGVVHSTAGYLLGAAATTKYIFDCHPGDVFGCTADIGWITGHTYLTYGPLLLGLTTVVFESIPTYPDASRYWKLVQDHKITQFYTSPTAIRALRRLGDSWVEGHDLSSLRVIGSVGEPINPEAWWWYHDKVGKGQCALVDTYWQTETGSIIVTPLPAATRTKPGSASMPFFGIDAVILDPKSGEPLEENNVSGVLAVRSPWPSVTRTVYQDHQRYLDNYLKPYPGYYCTGDGASRDQDGYIWIGGRMDDVINVSGHRLGTAEIESALILHPSVAETAVVGVPDPITGQSIFAFVALKPGQSAESSDLNKVVREQIGAFAAPKRLVFVDELPKTRSGKIIRRILRKVVAGEQDELGDLSTVSDPSVVDHLIERVHG